VLCVLFEPSFDEELRCCYRRDWGRTGVAAASSATTTWRSPAHQRYTHATPPSTLPPTTMHSVRRAGGRYVNKPTSRAMTSVHVQTDVVQPVQTAGRGTPVPDGNAVRNSRRNGSGADAARVRAARGVRTIVGAAASLPSGSPLSPSPVSKSNFSPRRYGYIESQTCRTAE